MQTSNNQGAIVHSASFGIAPAYQNVLAKYDLTNTICKMAQKRALVAAFLSSCDASQFFTQDLKEIVSGGEAK